MRPAGPGGRLFDYRPDPYSPRKDSTQARRFENRPFGHPRLVGYSFDQHQRLAALRHPRPHDTRRTTRRRTNADPEVRVRPEVPEPGAPGDRAKDPHKSVRNAHPGRHLGSHEGQAAQKEAVRVSDRWATGNQLGNDERSRAPLGKQKLGPQFAVLPFEIRRPLQSDIKIVALNLEPRRPGGQPSPLLVGSIRREKRLEHRASQKSGDT